MSKSTAKSTTDMSTANELSRPLNAGYPPSQGPKTAPRTRPLPRKDRDGTTVPDLSAPPGVKHETDDMTKTRWISKRGTSTAGHRPFTPAWISKPDSISLKVGEKLKSPLKSSDGKSTISLGIDGSIRFRKELPEAEGASRDVDYGNSDTDAPKVLSTTLVPSDKRKAVRVLEARLAPKDERAAEETLHGRRKLRDWSGPRALKRWLEEVTRPDIAEVEMTVTNRGCVVSVLRARCCCSFLFMPEMERGSGFIERVLRLFTHEMLGSRVGSSDSVNYGVHVARMSFAYCHCQGLRCAARLLFRGNDEHETRLLLRHILKIIPKRKKSLRANDEAT